MDKGPLNGCVCVCVSVCVCVCAISILVISNHNSFRVVYLKNIFIFEHWTWPAQGTGTVPTVLAHLRSLLLAMFCVSVGHDLSCANMTEQAGHKPGKRRILREFFLLIYGPGWLGSRVVSMPNSGAEGPGFKSQPRCCPVTVLGKLFRPVVPPFTVQRNW